MLSVELMELYSTDSHLKSYLPIIRKTHLNTHTESFLSSQSPFGSQMSGPVASS